MAPSPSGYLPDRPRPAWFGALLVTLFIAMIAGGFAGAFRTPRVAGNPFEKRAAEPLPSFPDSRAALSEYPARFERFFDDRFGMRATLVHIDHWVKATVFGVSPVSKVLIGKSGWLYFRGEDSKAFDRWYRGSETVPDTTLIAARDELLRRQAFLAGRGIPFVVVVVPEKYSVYPEFLPDWATRIAPQTPLDRFAADLAALSAAGIHRSARTADGRQGQRPALLPDRFALELSGGYRRVQSTHGQGRTGAPGIEGQRL